jgi:hypothetical protein
MLLADKRLTTVLTKFTDRICQKQHLIMRKLACDRKEEIQFGRFIRNERVQVDQLEVLLYEQFRHCCPASGHLLLLEDTTQIGFSLERKISGLGPLDKGQIQGFYLHPVLCLDAENGACYGMPAVCFHQRTFKAEKLTGQQAKALNYKTPFEDQEAYRWYHGIVEALKNCPPTASKTVVADRESDIYAVLTGLQDLGVDYLIRSRHNRELKPANKLYTLADTFSQAYEFTMAVPATDGRSAHRAVLQVSFGQVELKKSGAVSRQPLPTSHSCRVVQVKEATSSVVGKEEPIHWLLLPSHPVESSQQALQLIEYYRQRWNIEQLFRTLKAKGLGVETSQVSEQTRLKKLLLLALMAAVKVLQLVRARAGTTNQAITCAFNSQEQELLTKLNPALEGRTEKLKNPYQANTLAFAAWIIARLAGWSGYQSQRPPGPIDFLVGLQRFEERYQGFRLSLIT